jgi:ATPase subunit of ABC transporter with duplicated ATPase domains
MIEKMRKEGKLTPPSAGVISKQWSPSLVLPPPPKALGDTLVAVKGGDFGHESIIVSNANLEITRGMKLILRGPNGAGKSTLMAVLRGDLELRSGTRVENESLRLGSFTQDLAQQLDVNARAIDIVTDHARGGRDGDITVSNEDARGVMGRIGLSGDKVCLRNNSLPSHFFSCVAYLRDISPF